AEQIDLRNRPRCTGETAIAAFLVVVQAFSEGIWRWNRGGCRQANDGCRRRSLSAIADLVTRLAHDRQRLGGRCDDEVAHVVEIDESEGLIEQAQVDALSGSAPIAKDEPQRHARGCGRCGTQRGCWTRRDGWDRRTRHEGPW